MLDEFTQCVVFWALLLQRYFVDYAELQVVFSIAALDEAQSLCMGGVTYEEARVTDASIKAGYIAFRMIGNTKTGQLFSFLLQIYLGIF